MQTFKERVLTVVRSIPRGSTMSYQEVARLAGNSKAARAVGSIMKKNTHKQVPCHRVIRSNKTVGGYNGLRGDKEYILRQEHAIY